MPTFPVEVRCEQCGKSIQRGYTETRKYWSKRRFCSNDCTYTYRRANHRPCHEETKQKISNANKGKKKPPEFGEAVRKRLTGVRPKSWRLRSGEDNGKWKGDEASYSAIHYWMARTYGKPDHCDICGLQRQPKKFFGKKNYFHWSNRTGVYDRNAHNWWQLCTKCHKRYDVWLKETLGRACYSPSQQQSPK